MCDFLKLCDLKIDMLYAIGEMKCWGKKFYLPCVRPTLNLLSSCYVFLALDNVPKKKIKTGYYLQTSTCNSYPKLPKCLDCKADHDDAMSDETYCRFTMFRRSGIYFSSQKLIKLRKNLLYFL